MIALFYVTFRAGGLDVLESNLERSTIKPDVLLVVDELNRNGWFEDIAKRNGVYKTGNIPPIPINSGNGEVRNLARAYNQAAEVVVDLNCDLLLSMQDFIWVPSDGIERFKKIHTNQGDNILLTGLTSISRDPLLTEIDDMDAYYTIFKKPYKSKPEIIAWHDIREKLYQDYFSKAPIVTTRDPNHWEANWAAVPVELFRRGLKWDEDYDKGVAFENNDLALRAIMDYDCDIVLDRENHAISLPHKKYWPADESEEVAVANQRNMKMYQEKFDNYVARLNNGESRKT